MVIAFIVVGLALISIGVLHEYSWLKKGKGKIKKGIVTSNTEDTSGDSISYIPIIKFHHQGIEYEFTSEYSKSFEPIEIGTEIQIFVPDDPSKAEWYTSSNRSIVTIAPIAVGILFILFALQFET